MPESTDDAPPPIAEAARLWALGATQVEADGYIAVVSDDDGAAMAYGPFGSPREAQGAGHCLRDADESDGLDVPTVTVMPIRAFEGAADD